MEKHEFPGSGLGVKSVNEFPKLGVCMQMCRSISTMKKKVIYYILNTWKQNCSFRPSENVFIEKQEHDYKNIRQNMRCGRNCHNITNKEKNYTKLLVTSRTLDRPATSVITKSSDLHLGHCLEFSIHWLRQTLHPTTLLQHEVNTGSSVIAEGEGGIKTIYIKKNH